MSTELGRHSPLLGIAARGAAIGISGSCEREEASNCDIADHYLARAGHTMVIVEATHCRRGDDDRN